MRVDATAKAEGASGSCFPNFWNSFFQDYLRQHTFDPETPSMKFPHPPRVTENRDRLFAGATKPVAETDPVLTNYQPLCTANSFTGLSVNPATSE